ncbi:DEAD/DEAH box helicase [Plebeiibacterium marinum]|uniref:DEAD/DEAH box helicase n=1 Tax=Plebeiibacterium marinum TaxID=2992111 RepID=A0AAE3MGK4_9BACT|nr:DEAD/DEAH box helicase [Plebeiobacterium marinum]MCW3807216.1 DEAD/DEAH box helicase [Plebeiobacterium marinum]
MAQQFGKTWWGEHFLKALTDIDYSNRLPRGRSYARNGYVASINIINNRIEAKVKGSRRTPYKVLVTVPLFTDAEKKKLLQAISQDPLLLSHLLNRELPHELNEIAKEHHIAVFPNKWSDFDMQCSCPDWAVPCKHLASVIYMISAEIDRNPFLIFQLHGLDILKELTKTGMTLEKEMDIPDFQQQLLDGAPEHVNEIKEDSAHFDLSKITPQTDKLLSLLEPRSIFYDKPFVPLLRKNFKAVSRYSKTLLGKEEEGLELKAFESIETVELFINDDSSFQKAIFHSDNGDLVFDTVDDYGIDSMINFLARLPKKYEQRLSSDLKALYRAWHLSVKLAENGAFLPQILALKKNENVIRWIPAIINEEVNALLNMLEQGISLELVKVYINAKKHKYLSIREQCITLVSLFLTHYIKENNSVQARTTQYLETKIEQLFFRNKCYSFNQLGEKQMPEAIHQYLQRFFIGEKPYVPLIKIDDKPEENSFEFQIWVEDRKDSLQKPISLNDFINNKAYNKFKTSLFQSLASLSHDFSAIKPLISSSGKEQLFFDSDTFAEVLLNILPIVKLLGIRILLPNSLKSLARPKASLKLESNSSGSTGKSYFNLNEMLQFEWQIAIGDKTIPVGEFKKMVDGTSGVVNIKGEYVLVDQKEVSTMLANLDAEKQLSHAELLQSALTEEYQEAKISISDTAKELINELLQSDRIASPAELNATLRPYQERGYQWLYNNSKVGFGSIIADDMGLGKTLQVISLLLQFKNEGRFEKKKALIVVPTTLITNWQKEIERFAPQLLPHIYHGAKREFKTDGCDLVITSYGMLRSDASKFQKVKWELVAIDEAQNIKNPGTEQTKAVKKLKADVKIAMSGTPVENRLSEYWSLFDFVNKGYLGSAKFFKKAFASPIENDNNGEQLERFRKITEPFILRRLKTDKSIISDLPEKIEHDCFIELAKEQTALYQNVVDSMMETLENTEEDSIERKGLVLKMMTALKQVCNHPSQFLKKEDDRVELSGKTEMLIQLLRSICESDEKVLIFTQYKEMGQILVRILENVFDNKPLFLHGGVSRQKRDEMVEAFQTKKHKKIFILSIKAGGTGLNLTAANHVVHYDLWWNPAVEAQATDRAFRIGQQKNVLVHRMISKGTFEEKINEMLLDKKHLADLAVSTGEKWIGDLSNAELKDLVRMKG